MVKSGLERSGMVYCDLLWSTVVEGGQGQSRVAAIGGALGACLCLGPYFCHATPYISGTKCISGIKWSCVSRISDYPNCAPNHLGLVSSDKSEQHSLPITVQRKRAEPSRKRREMQILERKRMGKSWEMKGMSIEKEK